MTVTKHDIGRRYTKIVRKILRLSEKLVDAETHLEFMHSYPTFLSFEEAEKERDICRENLRDYTQQSLKGFWELVERQPKDLYKSDKAIPGEDYTVKEKKMSIAGLVLNTTNVYNGHNQLNIIGIPSDEAINIMQSLQEELPYHLVSLRVYSDNSWCIEQENFWKEGEHPNGHRDKILISGEV